MTGGLSTAGLTTARSGAKGAVRARLRLGVPRPAPALARILVSGLRLLEREGAEIACATSFWAPPAALLFRRSVVEQIGGFRDDLSIIDDARFLFDAAHCGARFVHAPHLGAYYRVRPGSLSRRDPAKFWLDVLHNGEQIEALWRARGKLDAAQLRAIGNIFDGTARSLFEISHPSWRRALAALERNHVVPSRKLRAARLIASLLGDALARRMVAVLAGG